MNKLEYDFFKRDVLDVAPDLVGKIIVRSFENGTVIKLRITETEAYRGQEDKACHACKGRTKRTEVMYHTGGTIYVYLIYGIHWLLNIVTGEKDNPQAVLIRATREFDGPGKLTKALKIDKRFNSKKIYDSKLIHLADDLYSPEIITKKRIGIEYAGEVWANKAWRFVDKNIYKNTSSLK